MGDERGVTRGLVALLSKAAPALFAVPAIDTGARARYDGKYSAGDAGHDRQLGGRHDDARDC
jgi:hypothetical protein